MPKGDCYKVALEFPTKLTLSKDDIEDKWLVCHGIIKIRNYGLMNHAWNEFDGFVYDRSNGNNWKIKKQEFYNMLDIKAVNQYHFFDAVRKAMKKYHCGPWHYIGDDIRHKTIDDVVFISQPLIQRSPLSYKLRF